MKRSRLSRLTTNLGDSRFGHSAARARPGNSQGWRAHGDGLDDGRTVGGIDRIEGLENMGAGRSFWMAWAVRVSALCLLSLALGFIAQSWQRFGLLSVVLAVMGLGAAVFAGIKTIRVALRSYRLWRVWVAGIRAIVVVWWSDRLMASGHHQATEWWCQLVCGLHQAGGQDLVQRCLACSGQVGTSAIPHSM